MGPPDLAAAGDAIREPLARSWTTAVTGCRAGPAPYPGGSARTPARHVAELQPPARGTRDDTGPTSSLPSSPRHGRRPRSSGSVRTGAASPEAAAASPHLGAARPRAAPRPRSTRRAAARRPSPAARPHGARSAAAPVGTVGRSHVRLYGWVCGYDEGTQWRTVASSLAFPRGHRCPSGSPFSASRTRRMSSSGPADASASSTSVQSARPNRSTRRVAPSLSKVTDASDSSGTVPVRACSAARGSGPAIPEASRPVAESRQVVAVLRQGGSVLGRAGGQSVERRAELLADLIQAVVSDSGRLPVLVGQEEGRVAEDEVFQRSPADADRDDRAGRAGPVGQIARVLVQGPNAADRVGETVSERPGGISRDVAQQQSAQRRGEPGDAVHASGLGPGDTGTVEEDGRTGSRSREVLVLLVWFGGQRAEDDVHAVASSSCR
ncbi:hypothetical protein RKD35_003803 [Streptomyces albogriseolus]